MSYDELVPPLELIFDGTTSQADFVSGGDNFIRHFLIERALLTPDSHVLDLGSGIGQKARPLTRFLNDDGRYEGIDIVAAGIDWCRHAYRRYPGFHFQRADIHSVHYNPEGRLKASDYRFPFADASFQMVLLSSVFTHMLPHDMEHYFGEIARVLRTGGRCVVTFFLLNPESRRRIEVGLNTIKVPHRYGSDDCRVADITSPETTVAHDEVRVRGLFDRNRLSITDVTYGFWCGRQEFFGCLQDVIIAMKE